MAGYGNGQQDLASILRTLSSFSTPPAQAAAYAPPLKHASAGAGSFSQTASTTAELASQEREEGEYDPNDYDPSAWGGSSAATSASLRAALQQAQPSPLPGQPSAAPIGYVSHAAPSHHHPQQHQQQQQAAAQPPKPQADPRTMTTWPAALRYVSGLLVASGDGAALTRVRRLVTQQRQHERQWWAGREDLVRRQRERGSGRAAIRDVLRAVGGVVASTADAGVPGRSESSPEGAAEDDRRELAAYDAKIHRAYAELVAATEAQLAAIGVPFFAIRKDLVKDADDDRAGDKGKGKGRGKGGVEERGVDQRPISTAELRNLQRKMLDLLEDMCKE